MALRSLSKGVFLVLVLDRWSIKFIALQDKRGVYLALARDISVSLGLRAAVLLEHGLDEFWENETRRQDHKTV